MIELPEYKSPNAHTIAIYVWQKIKDYLTKAGTVIFVASVIMWILLNFGPQGYVTDISQSFGSMIGKAIVPLFKPTGLGYWQIIVALIAGIAAKEVVVSSCSVLFGIQNITTAGGMDAMVATLGAIGFGPANAYAMMVFCLLDVYKRQILPLPYRLRYPLSQHLLKTHQAHRTYRYVNLLQ